MKGADKEITLDIYGKHALIPMITFFGSLGAIQITKLYCINTWVTNQTYNILDVTCNV